ncbi:Bug family tripartite tricarboxylate transporter substrate binding protein [Devosia beringensis]|uniref:Bug family tripartite tricarboxylate transporter substrate binding protein n=1 Tax=Devosia beringensis TaxID=2657486 RepID=UPI00186BA90D|nr:tripartite tricarboxylate transporter substrate binding protein [Devosia beringensis]
MKRYINLVAAGLVGLVAGVMPLAANAQEFPTPGSTVTMIVPVPPGGGTDQFARVIAPLVEADLGVTVQVVNKPGASMQIGSVELVGSKPDGYTVMWMVLPTAAAYLDEERQSTYGRDDFQPIASLQTSNSAATVLASSPYNTVEDLIAAAKANPGSLKAGTAGRLSTGHLASLDFARSLGIKLATVNFTGGAQQMTALLGGHIDVSFNTLSEVLPQVASGQLRILGVMADGEDVSGVKTFKAQGYDVGSLSVDLGVVGPANMEPATVDILAASLKKALDAPETQAYLKERAINGRFLNPSEYAAAWDEIEKRFKPLIDLAKQDGN